MRHSLIPFLLASSAVVFTSSAMAQSQPGARPQPPPQTPPSAPAAAPGTAPAQPEAPTPRTIEVTDPLLSPVPPATRVLADWRAALSQIASRSSDLRIAVWEVDRSKGVQREALGLALPQITATGTLSHDLIRTDVETTQVDPSSTPGDVRLSTVTRTLPSSPRAIGQITVSQPILAPRVWYQIGTAEKSVDLAKLSLEDRRRTVLAGVASAIVAVVTAERVSEVNRVGLRNALQRLELFQRRQRLGSGTMLDIVRAEQDVTLARATLITGDESLQQTREALGLALGSSDAYGVPPNISLNDIEASARSICHAATPDTRSDVLASKAQLEIAERGVTDAKLLYAPTAEVSTTASIATEEFSNQRNYAWSIQGVLTVPIWDGGSRYGTMRAAKANVGEQKERVESTRRIATIEATQSTRAVRVADQAVRLAERNRDLANDTANLTQKAFDAGAATSFELVDAARKLREAELDLAVKEFDLVRTKIAALLAVSTCSY